MHGYANSGYSRGDLLCRRVTSGFIVCLVLFVAGEVVALDTGIRNETAYSVVVEVREPGEEGTGELYFDGALAPGEQAVFDVPAGENVRPWLTGILHDGSWKTDKTGFMIYQFVNTNQYMWRPRKETDKSWSNIYGSASAEPGYHDFAAGTTFVFRGGYKGTGGYSGVKAEDKGSNEEWDILDYMPLVEITIQNNTQIDLEMRSVADGETIGDGSWTVVGAGLQQSEQHEAPWHFEVTNDGGDSIWVTPEPGVDSVFIVSADGAGGLQLQEGETDDDDDDITGELPGEEPEPVPDADTPGYLHDEATEDLEFDRWDTGDTGYDYYWDNTLAAVESKDWETCAPELSYDLGFNGIAGTITIGQREGDTEDWMFWVRWTFQLICYVATVLVCIRLVMGA